MLSLDPLPSAKIETRVYPMVCFEFFLYIAPLYVSLSPSLPSYSSSIFPFLLSLIPSLPSSLFNSVPSDLHLIVLKDPTNVTPSDFIVVCIDLYQMISSGNYEVEYIDFISSCVFSGFTGNEMSPTPLENRVKCGS